MPRPAETLPRRARIRKQPTRPTPVLRRDARAHALRGIDRDRVRRAIGISILGDHLRQLEFGGEGGRDGDAEEAAGVADEEGAFGGREVGGGEDEVAFVFALGGVEDDDGVAGAWEGRLACEVGFGGVGARGEDVRKDSMASGMVSKSSAPLVVAMVGKRAL